ncbi:MAG: hypothetical protein IPN54_09410 [Bacteroidetes bacterium]|nr:hypothetical protein [Bacteroidota bacterium]
MVLNHTNSVFHNSYGKLYRICSNQKKIKNWFCGITGIEVVLRDPDIVAFPSGSLLFMSGAVTFKWMYTRFALY